MRYILFFLLCTFLANGQTINKNQLIGSWACDSLLIQGINRNSNEASQTLDNLLAFTFFTFSDNEMIFSSMGNRSKGNWAIVENKIFWNRQNRTDTFHVKMSKSNELILEQYNKKRLVNSFYLFPLKVVHSNEKNQMITQKWKSKIFIPSELGLRDSLNESYYRNSWINFDTLGACQITLGAVMTQGHYWINKSANKLTFKDLAGNMETMKLNLSNQSLILTRPTNAGGNVGAFQRLEFYIEQ